MEASAQAQVPPRLKERYEQEVAPSLQKRFGYKSAMEVPRVEKITLNMGVGDAKQDSNVLDAASSSSPRSPARRRTCAARASRSRTSSCATACPWA
jgi:hypothetical protein